MAKALNCLDLKDGEPCNQCEMKDCKKINEGLAIDITELYYQDVKGLTSKGLVEKI